jgi:Trk-type K+ transport system membrane component
MPCHAAAMAAAEATAATAAAAVGCQQHRLETRHVSSLWYVFFLYFFSYFFTTLMFIVGPFSTFETATAAAEATAAAAGCQQLRLETQHVSSF